ncbi:hypothetical protein QYZ88_015355 [Lachnospiraceae bacterium C1.1]|nr:hypothetical protein [Lachnospiraceae bacterium C1.1]
MNKKSISLILSMALLFSMNSPAFAEEISEAGADSASVETVVVADENTVSDSATSSSNARSANEYYGSMTVSAAELKSIVENGSSITISSCAALPYVGKRIKYGKDINLSITVSNNGTVATFDGLDARLSARTHNDSISNVLAADSIKAQLTRISISRKDLRTAFKDKTLVKKVRRDIVLVSRALRRENVKYEITEYPAHVSANRVYSKKKQASKTGDLIVKVKNGQIKYIKLAMVTTKNHSGKKSTSLYYLKNGVDYEIKSGMTVVFKGGHVTNDGKEMTLAVNN